MKYEFLVSSLALVLAIGGVAGCDRNQGQAEPPNPADQSAPEAEPPAVNAQAGQVCPMAIEGVDVSVSDTEDGVALTFTTERGDVEALRQRVRHMAVMHESRHPDMHWRHMGRGGGGMGPGRGRGMMGPGPGAGPMPEVEVEVEEIEGGARLDLTPVDEGDLETLRRQARLHQERMQAGQCWMPREGRAQSAPAR